VLSFITDTAEVRLNTETGTNRFLEVSGILRKAGAESVSGTTALTNMGITNYNSSLGGFMPPSVVDAIVNILNAATEPPAGQENIEMQELSAADRVHESIENISTEMHKNGITYTPQEIRDIIALDKTLQTINGQAKLSAAKISALEDGIVELENKKESKGITNEKMAEIDKNIKELKGQRDIQRDHLRVDIEPKIRYQTNRIRETIYKMMNEDTTLGERVRARN
jgi:hypothetical protein